MEDKSLTVNDEKSKITPLQRSFIEEFVDVKDPFKAAIKAGYDEKKARILANRFNSIKKIIGYIEELEDATEKVKDELMATWQPVSAISSRSGVPIRTSLKILVRMYNAGEVKMSYSRIDGHNKVHMFKKIETQTIMGVVMPVETEGMEL